MDAKMQKRLLSGILNDDDNAVREIIGERMETVFHEAVERESAAFFESLGTRAAQSA